MKILLINPPSPDGAEYIREGRCMQAKSSWAALWMPLTLAYAASCLRKNGRDVRLLDCIADKLGFDDLVHGVRSLDPGLLILNTAFPTLRSDIGTARLLKRSFKNVRIAAIGLCGTVLKEGLLREAGDLDYVIIGEPEWALRDLARALETGTPLREVRGLIFRDGGEIVITSPQTFSRNNLDDLPFPARDLLHNERYRLPLTGEKFTLLSIGRGCPYQCIYCTSPLYYGKTFRKRSVLSIVDEISECVTRHEITNFLFWGESFTMDADYGGAICREILSRGLRITWSTTSRVDALNPGLLGLMKRAGCSLLGLGIESTSQEILNRAHKGTTVRQIEAAVQMVKDAGIKSMGHFMFGLPGETRETAETTIRYALASGIGYAQFYCAVPYPGTELGDHAEKAGWIESRDCRRYDLALSVMKNETLSPAQVKRLRDSAYRRFYLRPHMVLKTLREADISASFAAALDFIKWIRAGKKQGPDEISGEAYTFPPAASSMNTPGP